MTEFRMQSTIDLLNSIQSSPAEEAALDQAVALWREELAVFAIPAQEAGRLLITVGRLLAQDDEANPVGLLGRIAARLAV